MCGRFALLTPTETLVDVLGIDAPVAMPPSVPRYNIAPTQPVLAAYTDSHGRRALTFFQWGLIPSWAKDPAFGAKLINARAETVADKPSFRNAFKRRRCLIPADGFYEWQKTDGRKQPMFIHPTDPRPFAFAGLWESWQDREGSHLQTCTILTIHANELMRPIHDRMPVILEPDDFAHWLDPGPNPDDALHLLRPYPAEKMATYAVSTAVNNARNDSPACIQPLHQDE